jgi:very-short-patch-repair endonuclease
MPSYTVLLAIAALILFFAMLATRQAAKSRKPLSLQRKPVMTAREQKMYQLLQTALPECTVLAQVAFSALVTAKGWANRNRFDRKVADFVLCSQQLNVIAVIELDDSSHAGRERQDKERDAMLRLAGYVTLRYANFPTQQALRTDVEKLLAQRASIMPA